MEERVRRRRAEEAARPIKHKVRKSFTDWKTRTKYKVGDVVMVDGSNEDEFAPMIEKGWLVKTKRQ